LQSHDKGNSQRKEPYQKQNLGFLVVQSQSIEDAIKPADRACVNGALNHLNSLHIRATALLEDMWNYGFSLQCASGDTLPIYVPPICASTSCELGIATKLESLSPDLPI
jgi:hypothetical protein